MISAERKFDSVPFKKFLLEHGEIYAAAKQSFIEAYASHKATYGAAFDDDDKLAIGAGVVAALLSAESYWKGASK